MLGAAALLFLGVLVALVVADDVTLGLALLAVVPVVLVGLELGQRGGTLAAMLAFAAVLAEAAAGQSELDAAGLATCGIVFLSTGVAAGRFSDRMRAVLAREERLLRSGLRLSEASGRDRLAEMALREALATPGVVGAVVRLDGLPEVGEGRLNGPRAIVPLHAHGLDVGAIEAYHDAPTTTEDRAALELLARQTAIVAESLRLLDLDTERAALESRLREVRLELLESRSGAGLLLRAEEEGKRRAAEKLHEDLAQVLSAVLLGMRMLERSRPADGSPAFEEIHEQVTRVLSEVRDVARDLRPVVLDQLGLTAALETLARAAQERGVRARLTVGPLPPDLPDDIETAVYRLVEDALALGADGAGADVTVDGEAGDVEVGIGVEAPSPEALLALRARAEAAGGTVTVTSPGGGTTTLRATMPVA
ncbi:MAG TPA: histidine kinase [Solirubrobacteraceae bacterium]|nr:histidine kinase [Solirubrobacteraceae bacterium]